MSAEDLAALSQKIADLSDPARAVNPVSFSGFVARILLSQSFIVIFSPFQALMFQTPEEILQNAMRKVANDMDKLQRGGPDSAEALKAELSFSFDSSTSLIWI